MKKVIALFFLLTTMAFPLVMEQVDENVITAKWDRNADNAAGYRIYWGERCLTPKLIADADSVELYDYTMDVGQDTFCTIVWPDSIPVYVCVLAYNSAGYSGPSDEAVHAPLTFYDRYPKNDFIDPYDGYKINQYYGFTKNYYLYDIAYDRNRDGIIDPADKYDFKQKLYGRIVE